LATNIFSAGAQESHGTTNNTMSSLNILISEPNARPGVPYLPYMWAIFKTYCEKTAGLDHGLRWLEPIYQFNGLEALNSAYSDTRIDVLGLSCYVWNWKTQLQIARQVKARNPDCLIVAGGPEPDHKDLAFFAANPAIDIVVVKDGELAFSEVLRKVAAGDADFSDVPGLYLPTPDRSGRYETRAAEVPTVFEHSPYVEQSAYYEQYMKRHGSDFVSVILETNRGCPYSCSYCDWGQNTMSKLRRFDMGRVTAEIDWIGRMQIDMCFLADANFGILERDLELADHFNNVREKYGKPKVLFYSAAKNNPQRTTVISSKLNASGISNSHTFSIQHTRDEVLACIDRDNISTKKQRQVAQYMHEHGIPIEVQLIVGLPGDNYRLWQSCLGDVMEWGLHEFYYLYSFSLLPNAPAAAPEYREKWQLETVRRRLPLDPPGKRLAGDVELLLEVEIVVQTKTYSRADWIKMKTYGVCVRALHNSSLTRLAAIYMRHTHGVPFEDFYRGVVDEYLAGSELGIYQDVAAMYAAYLASPDCDEEMIIAEMPDYPFRLDVSKWLVYRIAVEAERFYAGLTEYLRARYPQVGNIASVLEYEKNLLVVPRPGHEGGYSFVTDHDWVSYFARARRFTKYTPMAEPERTPGTTVAVTGDKATWLCGAAGGLDPTTEAGRERCIAWIDEVLVVHGESVTNFQEIVLRRADEPPPGRRDKLPVLTS
jgi:putative methyltransferase